MNTPLPLSPFPALPRAAAAGRMFVRTPAAMEGFVDEEVIHRLVARTPLETCPQAFRFAVVPADLVLPAEEQDYAGGLASTAIPQRSEMPAGQAGRVPLASRRATAPVLEKPGQAHRGGQRWWLAGIAGAFATTLIAVVLLTLTQPPVPSLPVPTTPPASAKPTDSAATKLPPKIQEMISNPTLPPQVKPASP